MQTAVSVEKNSEETTEHLPYNTTEASASASLSELSFDPDSEQISFAKDNARSNKEKLMDAAELTDLNERRVYYIYHPTGSFQKVVYAAKEADVETEEAGSTQRKYVLPIREPVVTYDPRTFVFQRLIRV
ncbi:unnamed protein product [Brassicogethes aeneus]|uniref:Uncharacterized protein n=1 Tax=Brassicogethes aeneus TaxID=1431903 RepID=A0A9P0AZG7_BRAAE|nr:unnamed protein product [Brassicogethes aeneus]